MIARDTYLNKLIKLKDNGFVKIITGIRRCGKSSLLALYREHLLSDGIAANNIIEINFERFAFEPLKDEATLHNYIRQKLNDTDVRFYLFIDEVQEIPAWAKVINSLRTSFPVDIYVTGSNSRLFSGEYLTYISGRYVELKMYPLSFEEFIRFRPTAQSREAAFNEYLRIGSFPATALANSEELITGINEGLFDSIFSRDILLRGKIRDEGTFYKVAKYVCDNIGNQLSANAVANTLKSQGHKIGSDTVDNYLALMKNAFLIHQCERYDIRGRERLRTNGKYYVADTGLRNSLLGLRSGNIGHVIENIVYLELLRRGYEVSVGKLDKMEVDFIARRGEAITYIQVSLSAMDENVLSRELSPFYAIRDNYPRMLITMDTLDLSQDGIKHRNLLDWLLEKQ